MKTLEITSIEELSNQVKQANTATLEGRQIVAKSCNKLYEAIEEYLYIKYGQNSVNDAFNDLTRGDFSTPFMCQLKKEKFELYYRIFTQECN